MKRQLLTSLAIVSFLSLSFISCDKVIKDDVLDTGDKDKDELVFKDFGPGPLVVGIEEYTKSNDDFRIALWTGNTIQLTLMSIPVGGEIGLEQHIGIDQFLRIEDGEGMVFMGDTEDDLDFVREVGDDMIVLVPSGKWHNIKNTGDEPLKIYSIYGPAEHPHSTIHKTPADDPHNH